jgi:hypothetical protein
MPMQEYNKEQIAELSSLIATTRTDLTGNQRKRVMCMITLDTHNRDIVQKMVRESVDLVTHFMWQSQLKLRWAKPEKGCVRCACVARALRVRCACDARAMRVRFTHVAVPLSDALFLSLSDTLSLSLSLPLHLSL